jgi:predicted RNA-binding protein associated with RNAse of E/G family
MRTVLERKVRLDGSVEEWACELLVLEPGRYAAVRYVLPAERTLRGTALVLPAGTVTIGHFWVDRAYTAYHWLSGGRTLGVYCSVAELLEVEPEGIVYLDLAVDILFLPGGEVSVLDEHELPSDLERETLKTIDEAVAALRADPSGVLAGVEAATRSALS